jgi:gamma-glutamyltranspeptidase/glutathione hydrolase
MERAASGTRWAIASPHTAATRAGAAAFAAGGNAIDAALAAATTLAVTYPQACGVGGDLIAVVHAGGESRAVLSAGRAPADADPGAVRAAHATMPARGPIPVTVPGVVAGWRALHEQGARRSWAEHFEVAIAAAHDGIPVAGETAAALAHPDDRRVFEADPGMCEVFYPGGEALARGALFTQPALGRTLEALAAGGAEALYGGQVGAAYVEGLRATGSPITLADLAGHEPVVMPTVRRSWRDLHVEVAPPPSPGFSLLQILALAERLGLDPDPAGADAGRWARLFLAAEHDVHRHLADPDRMQVEVAALLGDEHLGALAAEAAAPLDAVAPRLHPGGDTVAVVAADADGNAVSLIESLFHGFGSAILEPVTGIVAHDRGACFHLDPGHPGAFAPGVRPPHTLLPALVHDARGLAGVAGTMGGYQQPQIDAQTISRAFALGDHPGDAVAAARFTVEDVAIDDDVPEVVEDGIPGVGADAIAREGFRVERRPTPDGWLGHAHLIHIATDGTLHAGSDPRADGGALAG